MNTGLDVRPLRHPREQPIWLLAVALNAFICVGAVVFVLREGAWLFTTFPFMARWESQIRGIAVAAVLAPPLLVLARNFRMARVRGKGVKVTATQYGPIWERFRQQCDKLGITDPPRLYVSDEVDGAMHAHTAWRREYIVIGDDYLEKDLGPLADVWSFLLARELARLALDHVQWWDELLLAYVDRLPWVRRPLRHARTFSIDAVAAHLEPEGVRALVVEASGRRSLAAVDIAEQIRYALSVDGFWVELANLTDERPLVAIRLRVLYERGGFDLEHDLARFDRRSA